jgi:hypothetical protein
MLSTFLHCALKTVSFMAVVFCVAFLLWHQADHHAWMFHAVWRPDDTLLPITPIVVGLIGWATWMASKPRPV